MFWTRFLRITLLLIIIAGVTGFFIFDIDKKDIARYRDLEVSSNPRLDVNHKTVNTTSQYRTNVEKTIRFSQNGTPLQIKLNADKSTLQLSQFRKEMEAIEVMEPVRCWIQESLFYRLPDGRDVMPQADGRLLIKDADPSDPSSWISPDHPDLTPMQVIRYLEADRGLHHYLDNSFVANHATFSQIVTSGHTLGSTGSDQTVLVKALARSIKLTISNNDVALDAYDTRLSYPVEGQAKQVWYDGTDVHLDGDVKVVHEAGKMSADHATLQLAGDKKLSTVHLKGKVRLGLPDGGSLRCTEALFDQTMMTGRFWSHGNEQTVITYLNEKLHQVTCFGDVTIDHQSMVTTLNSPPTTPESTVDRRVVYTDSLGKVAAEQIKLHYTFSDNTPVLRKLTMKDNIHIVNTAPWESRKKSDRTDTDDKPSATLQYAIADTMEYRPETQKMLLGAHTGRRVLFYDQANNLQVSADGMEASRNVTTGKESVKGIGDVRFSLIDYEVAELEQLLHSSKLFKEMSTR